MSELNEEALAFAVSFFIQELDYDLWKSIKHDEEDGEDHMNEWIEVFRDYYRAYMETPDER